MPNHGNGRNVEKSDENRPTWRPQDDTGRTRRSSSDDDRMMRDRERDDERFMQRDRERYSHWDDRYDRDEGGYRSTERYGQGQSGYGAGRYEDDRSYQSRNQGYPRSFDERSRERGVDERFAVGRGGGNWGQDRGGYERSGYGHGEYQPGNYLGQAGQQMGHDWGNEGYTGRGGTGQRDWQSYGNQGMRGYGYSEQRDFNRGGNWNQGGYGGQGYQTGNWGNQGMQGGYGDQRIGAAQGGWNQQSNYPQQGGRELDQRDIGYARGGYGQFGTVQGDFSQGIYGGAPGSQGQGNYGEVGGRGQREIFGRPQRGYGSGHRGKGPSGFVRSDERVKEMVCEALTDHDDIDATHIDITVKNGEVVLSGTVEDRQQKRLAEDIVEQCAGVKDVQNQLRVGTDKKTPVKETDPSSTMTSDKRHRA